MKYSHLTPRYIKDRFIEKMYRKNHPDEPWLAMEAIKILSTYLKPTDIGLEFGSGKSTAWLASRSQRLTSVEANEDWYNKVKDIFKSRGIENVDYKFCPLDVSEEEGDKSAYALVADSLEDDSLDYVLSDGHYRAFTTLKSIPKIKPGGVMIIDNVNWYLPSDSIAPHSRSYDQGPKDENWQKVWYEIKDWRRIWTSCGVSDTTFFFKPL